MLAGAEGTLADLDNNSAALTNEQATAVTEKLKVDAARVLSQGYKAEAEANKEDHALLTFLKDEVK